MILPQPDDTPLMTPAEAARALRVTPDTIRHWADAGQIFCLRIGPNGHRQYRRDDVEAMMTARQAAP